MNRWIHALMAFCLLALSLAYSTAAAQPAPAAEDPAVSLRQMAAEIERLRLEITEQAIEFQNWKLKRLEREMLAMQSEQQRLRELESGLQQQLAGLRDDLALGADQVGELEIVKAAHTEDGLKPIQLKRQSLAEQEAELREEIGRERARLQELQQKAAKIRAAD